MLAARTVGFSAACVCNVQTTTRRSRGVGRGGNGRDARLNEDAAAFAVLAILMYHSFAPTAASPELRDWTVPPALFEEQVSALLEHGVTFATVGDVPELLRSGDDHPPVVVISIDDAFADVVNAFEILERHRVPSTLFVPTGFVGSTADWFVEDAARRPLLDWPDLAALAGTRVELGSHGHWHIAADLNPPAMVLDDARRSRAAFEDHLAISPTSFAFPFGFNSPAARRAIRAAGFEQACAVRHLRVRTGDNVLALSRLYVGPQTDAATVVRLALEPRGRLVETALYEKERLVTVTRRLRSASSPQRVPPASLDTYARALARPGPIAARLAAETARGEAAPAPDAPAPEADSGDSQWPVKVVVVDVEHPPDLIAAEHPEGGLYCVAWLLVRVAGEPRGLVKVALPPQGLDAEALAPRLQEFSRDVPPPAAPPEQAPLISVVISSLLAREEGRTSTCWASVSPRSTAPRRWPTT